MDQGLFVKRNLSPALFSLSPSPLSFLSVFSSGIQVGPASTDLNSVAKENRCVAAMFIEHGFGGFAGIKREPAPALMNSLDEGSRAAANLRCCRAKVLAALQ